MQGFIQLGLQKLPAYIPFSVTANRTQCNYSQVYPTSDLNSDETNTVYDIIE